MFTQIQGVKNQLYLLEEEGEKSHCKEACTLG
jgi:hypothetical protein